MKIFVKRLLQHLLGFERYLYVFARYIIATLRWNRKEKDFLHFIRLIPDGGIVLDVGANIGAMTTYLSRRLKNTHIYAIEPVPCNVNTLKKIVEHYNLNNISIMETALGNIRGEIEMVLPEVKNVKLHGLSHVVHNSIESNNTGEHFMAPLCTLDSVHEFRNGKAVTGIKIDVENYEYYVLDGGRELIGRYHPVIYSELWENENRSRCFELLSGMGYTVNVLKNGVLVPFDPQLHKKQNFFFIPKK
jgi:FkbM family methyltransferase